MTFLPWTNEGKYLRRIESAIVFYEECIAFHRGQRDIFCGLGWLDLGDTYYEECKRSMLRARACLAAHEHLRRWALDLPVHYT